MPGLLVTVLSPKFLWRAFSFTFSFLPPFFLSYRVESKIRNVKIILTNLIMESIGDGALHGEV